MKPLYVTFAMAGLLLSSALGAQAHFIGSGASLCTLCQVPIKGNQSIDPKTACSSLNPKPPVTLDNSPWVDFQGAFFTGTGNKILIHGPQCVGEVSAPGSYTVALCCIQNIIPK